MSTRKKNVFISWTVDDTRSDSLAYHLGAKCYHVHYLKLDKFRFIYAPLKYFLASLKTISILIRERPEVILVQNPPPFSILVVWLYCIFSKAKFITDTHSGAFNLLRWKKFLWLYRFLAKRALTNIVHNEPLAHQISQWGVSTITLGDIPFHLETDVKYSLKAGFNVVFVSTYSEDEPINEMVNAANGLPDINFYITGDLNLAPKYLTSSISKNVILTGFIPHKDYVALLKGSDVVVALTTHDMTMQNGAYEALELGIPVITSDWSVLRQRYPKGAILIDNTSESLKKAIREIQLNHASYQEAIKNLRDEFYSTWNEHFSNLLKRIE